MKRGKGEVVWRKSFTKDFKGQIMVYSDAVTGPGGWGYCESPLVDGDQLIACPGGPEGWMIALDKLTGAVKWRTKDLTDEATDSSVVIATIGGVRQYINSTFKDSNEGGGIAGVDAKTGKLLWHFPVKKYGIYAVCPTPVVKDNLVYATAGYAAGCNLLRNQSKTLPASSPRRIFTPTKPGNRCKTITAAWCWWTATFTAMAMAGVGFARNS